MIGKAPLRVTPPAGTLPPRRKAEPQRMAVVRQYKTGRWFSVASMAVALASLVVAPAVLGPLGVLMGMAAVAKGDRYLGMLGVTASAVLAVTGYYLAGALLD